MISQDYYRLLNINRSATDNDIKKAYHKLAMEFHPDVNTEKEAEEKFKAISEAYTVLSNSQKRQIYDQTGSTNFAGIDNRANQPWGRGMGMGRGMGRGMGGGRCMGKCSGLDALLRRRPRKSQTKSTAPGYIQE
ncbi:DnaJ domain-containing protein [Desulfobacula sp.]|uniref:DnaJ domain-containing protein n=1 Tax=Desulfobacula sp. TaxID=2593537 RepID=UPI0026036DEB|nr:DnaJ domain-containing protein [Desulfobacula sp.]